MLVGQVRYPWLESVGGSPKKGWRTSELVRMSVDAQPGGSESRMLHLTLALPKEYDAASVAHEIGSRAARWRLTEDPQLHEAHRPEYEVIATGPPKAAVQESPGELEWAWYDMPSSYCVNSLTARPQGLVAPAIEASAEPEAY